MSALTSQTRPGHNHRHPGCAGRAPSGTRLALAGCLLLAGWCIPFSAHPDDDDHRKRQRTVNCDRGKSIQAAVDRVKRPTTLFIKGECHEDVLINKDDITLSGNKSGHACDKSSPGGAATVYGTVDIQGVRARVEFLTITGPGAGVNVFDRASAELVCNLIDNNDETGVVVVRSSFARLRNNTLSHNGQRRFDPPDVFFECGLFAGDAASVRSDGNTYKDNSYCGIAIDRQSAFRNGAFLPREPGHPADPALRDLVIERGCNPATGDGCLTSEGKIIAVEAFNLGLVDFRNVAIFGEVSVFALSSFRVDGNSEMLGNVSNGNSSSVSIRDRSRFGDRSVTFTGTLSCSNNSTTFGTVQCGQSCSGMIPGTCAP